MSGLRLVHRSLPAIPLMILLSASAPAAFAADGDLDPAFGSGGLVVTSSLDLVLLAVLLLGSGAVILRRRRAPGTAS
ncbi:MAG TPA: sortase B protein-sorting domain-containing protein [Thermoanaerobaculia bacterium]|jgi:hypothetical protein|nr:sortase B protein-sorting domain-containing protein [Thermoanaerobaculia bacterium]